MLDAPLMRALLVAVALCLLSAPPALAQCFAVTPSGKAFFQRALTKAEQCAARAEGKRRGCSEAPVAEGTSAAIDAAMAAQVLPFIRGELAAGARVCQAAATAAPARKVTRPPARARVARPPVAAAPVVIPLPRERPAPVEAAPPAVVAVPPPAEVPPLASPLRRGFLAWLAGLVGW